jgi:RNA polymerase sigma-70 factor (ECF subfamily)
VRDDSDAAEWARALGGEGEAFGRVFDRHRARVERHARWLSSDREDAADVVAMVFFEAWRKRAAVRFVDGSLLPWLLATAGNVARNQNRAARRYQALLSRLPATAPVPDHADSHDRETLALLATLPRRDVEVVVLSILEGYSDREVAEILRIPIGTAKSRLSRAKARLAELVRPAHPSTTGVEIAHERP